MRHALIMAGGSGTRLWPMSRNALPKQLIPFIAGKSLLQIAAERLQGLISDANCFVGAALQHQDAIQKALPIFDQNHFLGEPCGRDTLNAVALGAAVIAKRDPQAIIAVFTADHIIEPADQFRKIVTSGYELAEKNPNTLVTFGIAPTNAATGYGYLQLGSPLSGTARVVEQFKEKPDAATATKYFEAGPQRYLWNSGMFVWRADTLLDCIRRYSPANFDGIMQIAAAWDTPGRSAVLESVYPTLKKISVDFAVMEPASRDPKVQVAAVPMPLQWLDVGSWPFFAQTCTRDAAANAIAAERTLLNKTVRTLVASSDPAHLITTIGCEDLIVIHTPDATLVCRASDSEGIKELHKLVGEKFGGEYL